MSFSISPLFLLSVHCLLHLCQEPQSFMSLVVQSLTKARRGASSVRTGPNQRRTVLLTDEPPTFPPPSVPLFLPRSRPVCLYPQLPLRCYIADALGFESRWPRGFVDHPQRCHFLPHKTSQPSSPSLLPLSTSCLYGHAYHTHLYNSSSFKRNGRTTPNAHASVKEHKTESLVQKKGKRRVG